GPERRGLGDVLAAGLICAERGQAACGNVQPNGLGRRAVVRSRVRPGGAPRLLGDDLEAAAAALAAAPGVTGAAAESGAGAGTPRRPIRLRVGDVAVRLGVAAVREGVARGPAWTGVSTGRP